MKISKLILELERAKLEHGDIEVWSSSDYCCGAVTEIEKEEFIKDGVIMIDNTHS